MLEHRAAHLTFLPYNSAYKNENKRVMSITVKSTGKALAGTYKFDDRGLSNTPISDTSYTISMNFQPNGLKLDKKINKDLNAMTMVVAPGKYQKLEITYTVKTWIIT